MRMTFSDVAADEACFAAVLRGFLSKAEAASASIKGRAATVQVGTLFQNFRED